MPLAPDTKQHKLGGKDKSSRKMSKLARFWRRVGKNYISDLTRRPKNTAQKPHILANSRLKIIDYPKNHLIHKIVIFSSGQF